jgi:hypothetical protein
MEDEVKNVILGLAGEKDQFTIKYLGINWKLAIKPLSAKQLIQIGGEICKLTDIEDETETMFQALMKHANGLRFICRSIAIATGSRFQKIVTNAIMDLQLEDIQTLFSLVIKQSSAEHFFFIVASARSLNLMKKKTQ